MLAEIENREKVADVLISHGVNVNAMDSKGRTALMVAIEHGKLLNTNHCFELLN